jgi:two-component system, chemotaxis family, chemotaxis protein CheY
VPKLTEAKLKEVLVVDDSPVIRKIARRMLEAMSLKTSAAADGGTALAICGESMPDAILVDAHMPDCPGPEFLRQLRKLPDGEKPKVVICTSEHDVAQIARAMHAGADDFLLKPFDRDHLRMKFASVGVSTSELI